MSMSDMRAYGTTKRNVCEINCFKPVTECGVSIMVRRGNQRVSKKIHSSVPVQSAAVATPTPALPFGTLGGRSGSNPNVTLRQYGIEACPQCQTRFNSTNVRPVQEACGHIKCRTCFISNDDGCPQCNAERPRRGASNAMASSSRRTNDVQDPKADDLDLLPPLLTVEEPLASGSFISSEKRRIGTGPLKEPPVLSSVTASPQKPPLKRKQSKDFSPSSPSKVQKASLLARSPTKVYKETDSRERPKGRRSSTNSSRSEPMSTPSKSSKFSRQSDASGENLGSMKRSSRIELRKSTSTMQLNQHSAPATVANQLLSHGKDKSGRLRSSTGGSNSAASTGRWSQPSGSPPAGSRRKEQAQSPILAKPKLGLPRQETKNDKVQPFSMTISPTTIQSQKNAAIPCSSINKPELSPSDALPRRNEESSINFNAVSASRDDNVLPGCSSNDGSNSNSLETCDPLYIRNDWPDSNPAEGQISKAEPKKKKKRSPVTIHDHITILSVSGEPPLYQCNVCMKKFKTKAHIKYHEFCQNGEKPYKCEQCGQGFIAKSHYEYHLRTHTGERPYVCPKCGKGFNQRGKVTRHMRSHTGEKPFICQQCGRGFANAQALRSHFLIHTGERPFACQYCNKRFTGMTNLKKHVITHTGERPFSCNHCGKSFGLKWTLDLHLRTHSTERPFACDQCTRAFSNSKDLRRHLVIHSGERPFKCWICGTAFRRKDNLDRHIKNTHNQPKEVAKQLANEAAAEYLAQTKNNQVKSLTKSPSPKKTPASLFSPSSAKVASNDPVASTSRGHSMSKTDKKSGNKDTSENVGVIITADLSPPGSPIPVGADIGPGDVYILPNGQSDIQHGNLIQDVGASVVDTEVDPQGIDVQVFDGLAELRTVPVSEYHQIEGIKLLEKAKTTGEPAEPDEEHAMHGAGNDSTIQERDGDEKPIVDGNSDLLFCGTPATSSSSRQNFNHGLTVTVVYENDGKTHFITDQPTAYSSEGNPINFPSDQTNLLAIPRDTLFSFAPNDPNSVDAENHLSGATDSPPKSQDIQKKKSETILTGNLSKFLQMDLSKSAYAHNEGSEDSRSNSENLMDDSASGDHEELALSLTSDGSSAFASTENYGNYQGNNITSRNGTTIKEESLEEGEISQSSSVQSRSPFHDQAVMTLCKEIANERLDVTASDNMSQRPAVSAVEDSRDSLFKSRGEVELMASNNENDKLDQVLIIKREVEDVDYGKDKVCDDVPASSVSTSQTVHPLNDENKSTAKERVGKETSDATLQDQLEYPSDPMFQDHVADDEDKLQRSDENDQHLELCHDAADKESVDSILPDGIDHYESPEIMFQDKIVNSSHKLEDNAQSTVLLQDIVDKECPASILQDDNSNCGSVDPISDEEEGEFNEPMESKSQEASKSQTILPEKDYHESVGEAPDDDSNFLKITEKAGSELDIFKGSIHSHNNDTESISSTELEPMPEDRKIFEREFEGIVDEECPLSILEGEEDVSSDEGEIKPRRTSKSIEKVPSRWSIEENFKQNVKLPCIINENEAVVETCAEPAKSCTETLSSVNIQASTSICDGTDVIPDDREDNRDPKLAAQIFPDSSMARRDDETVGITNDDAQSLVKNPVKSLVYTEVEMGTSPNYTDPDYGEATDIEPISDTELEDLNENDIEPSSEDKNIDDGNFQEKRISVADQVDFKRQKASKRKRSEDNEDSLHSVKTRIAEEDENVVQVSLFKSKPIEENSSGDTNLVVTESNNQEAEIDSQVEQDQPLSAAMCKAYVEKNSELVGFDAAVARSVNLESSTRQSPGIEKQDSVINHMEDDTHITSEAVSSGEGVEKQGIDQQDGVSSEINNEPIGETVETAEKSTQCMNTEDFTDFNLNGDDTISDLNGEANSEVLKQDNCNDDDVNSFKISSTLQSTSETDLNDQNVSDVNIPDDVLQANTRSPERTQVECSLTKSDSSESMRPVSPAVKFERQNEMIINSIGDSESEADNSEQIDYEGISDTDEQPNQPSSSVSMVSDRRFVKNEVDYAAVPSSSTTLQTPSEARLVYTNSTTTGSLSSQPCSYSQANAVSYDNFVTPMSTETSDNYSFIYAPDAPTAVSSYPSKQSSFRFVYDNGEPVTEADPLDNKMRIVYACAAAAADPPGDSSGPQKLKLLYAEALGVGAPDDSGQVQLVYTSTTPNQNIIRGPNQNVQIYSPTLISADSSASAENIQMLFAQQSQLEQNSSPVPVEVLYNGNGTVMAQTVGQPQDLSWIKRDMSHSFMTEPTLLQHDKSHVNYDTNTRAPSSAASTREIANHHNYASNPYLSVDISKRNRHPVAYDGDSDGLRTLARAAANRMFNIQADADATTRAAAAIAAVGREAQIKRQMDIIERSRNLPGSAVFVRKGENVPHRGPRKRYLSQLTNSRK